MHDLPPARPVAVPSTSADLVIIGGACVITGWSFQDTNNVGGSSFEIYDGSDEGGALIAAITLIQNESTRDLISVSGLEILNGVFLEMISGTIKGSVWLIPAERYGPFIVETGDAPEWGGPT